MKFIEDYIKQQLGWTPNDTLICEEDNVDGVDGLSIGVRNKLKGTIFVSWQDYALWLEKKF